MAREQVLYQIFKLSSEFICENNLNIENYTKKDAIKTGSLISLGDNILFERIRNYRGDTRQPSEIFEDVCFYRNALRKAKKEERSQDARIIAQKLVSVLFVKDVVNVTASTKTSFRKVAKAGFYLNGQRFVAFSCGAGQARRETVTFINDEIYDIMYKTLSCGIDEKVKEINLAKFSAYFALTSSSIMWVDTPRCCVVPDFETTVKNQKVDWICKDENGEGYVEERILDVTLNSADGQGLVSPEFASRWAENMGLDYCPSQFVARSAYIKGDFVVFDFKEYAKRNNITRIYDIYGVGYDINEIDCLLSESQFKMYKYYSTWQEYLSYTEKYGIKWGIARYNKKRDPIYSQINYQFIQVLDLSNEDIKNLVDPTIDWINKICSGEDLYALLYSLGGFDSNREKEITYNDVYTRAQSVAMQAVVKNPIFLKDSYVQSKIYKNIVETINRAKIGKIWARGNYQFAVSDPIAQCRNALGLDPTGAIPADHVYSNFWNRLNVTGKIMIGRNPCIDEHEINPCSLYRDEETDYWYQYLDSGIVFSIYDTSVCRMEDSDFDGDIVYSTDNSIMVNGAKKDETNIIMYDKQKAPNKKINHRNLIESYIKGFGNKVGTYSNDATIIEAMKALFKRPDQKKQRDELERRKKLLREIVGAEIDSTKGLKKPKEPWYFRKFVTVSPDATEEDIKNARYHNSLVIHKKPYFFRYLYPELNKKYKTFDNHYNEICKCLFQTKFKKLITKKELTKEETSFIWKYHKYVPLINSNCTMNILCRMFEKTDFDIKYSKDDYSMLPYIQDYNIDENILIKIRDMYREYCNKKTVNYIKDIYSNCEEDDYKEIRFDIIDQKKEEIRDEIDSIGLSTLEILTYIKKLSGRYSKFNWAFAWDIIGEDILDCIEQKDAIAPVMVDKDVQNSKEYLGSYYILKTICYPNKENRDYTVDPETGEIIYG